MQHIKNTEHHYSLISIFFHWIMAALIIVLLALGLSWPGSLMSDLIIEK